MGLSQINDIDLMNEKKSLNKLFECSFSLASHRKVLFLLHAFTEYTIIPTK